MLIRQPFKAYMESGKTKLLLISKNDLFNLKQISRVTKRLKDICKTIRLKRQKSRAPPKANEKH